LAYLSRVSLTNYRTFREAAFDLPPGVSVFHGANGEGKTAVLEAVYTLAVGRSFRTEREREVVNFDAARNAEAAYVEGAAERDGQAITAVVGYLPGNDPQTAGPDACSDGPAAGIMPAVRKQIRVNRQPSTASNLLGRIGATLFFADDVNLVLGPPAERRRYLDVLISQADRYYLTALQRYQAALRNRNGLLRRQREGRVEPDEMRYWDDQLVAAGSTLVQGRAAALEYLATAADEVQRSLADAPAALQLVYQPRVPAHGSAEDTASAFREELEKSAAREQATATTVVGPHRDDFIILAGGRLGNSYASRGEARTIALALRLAEADYLAQVRQDDPIILLDDVLSEMDANRRERVLDQVAIYRQALITTTDVEPVRAHFGDNAAYFHVSGGVVTRRT
jgi:DNA replication and repair protein RecF